MAEVFIETYRVGKEITDFKCDHMHSIHFKEIYFKEFLQNLHPREISLLRRMSKHFKKDSFEDRLRIWEIRRFVSIETIINIRNAFLQAFIRLSEKCETLLKSRFHYLPEPNREGEKIFIERFTSDKKYFGTIRDMLIAVSEVEGSSTYELIKSLHSSIYNLSDIFQILRSVPDFTSLHIENLYLQSLIRLSLMRKELLENPMLPDDIKEHILSYKDTGCTTVNAVSEAVCGKCDNSKHLSDDLISWEIAHVIPLPSVEIYSQNYNGSTDTLNAISNKNHQLSVTKIVGEENLDDTTEIFGNTPDIETEHLLEDISSETILSDYQHCIEEIGDELILEDYFEISRNTHTSESEYFWVDALVDSCLDIVADIQNNVKFKRLLMGLLLLLIFLILIIVFGMQRSSPVICLDKTPDKIELVKNVQFFLRKTIEIVTKLETGLAKN
ncbi:hypothetical protein NPIL_445201 [Nephila pilipes]|uniref:Uncharacterized protein n=1 Tax=Nephila pilipes TaxID=299642 RepID=A0A8X6QRL4_NEPPI|nr:hypothetical protein NPIL_335731 [Nephila pilipes]GFU39486.1 hypothetical protein NPIL_445201 [Nephila pilipes]